MSQQRGPWERPPDDDDPDNGRNGGTNGGTRGGRLLWFTIVGGFILAVFLLNRLFPSILDDGDN